MKATGRLRLLLLSQYYEPEVGAAQTRLAALVRGMREAGWEVEVVTAMPNYPQGKIFPEFAGRFYRRDVVDGVTIHRVWVYAAMGQGAARLLNFLSFCVTSMVALVRCRRPSHVLVESPPLFLFPVGWLFARIWRARVVLNIADLWPDSIRHLGVVRDGFILRVAGALERWSYRAADLVSHATEGIGTVLVNEKQVPPAKVVFLPNGVDTQLFQPRERDAELARSYGVEGKTVVLYAGTHGLPHGIEVALIAADLLRSRTDIEFMFIGGGSEKNSLMRRASELDLANVRFFDPVQPAELARVYSFADIALSTLKRSPLFEGTRPAKLFTAMAAGVPIVYSGEGEGARLVRDARAGVITGPEDAAALASAVEGLADDAELGRELGANGRRWVAENLDWSEIVATFSRRMKTEACAFANP